VSAVQDCVNIDKQTVVDSDLSAYFIHCWAPVMMFPLRQLFYASQQTLLLTGN